MRTLICGLLGTVFTVFFVFFLVPTAPEKKTNGPIEAVSAGFDMLDEQKRLLLKQLGDHSESSLQNIVHIIGAILDEAEKQGLWKSPARDDFGEGDTKTILLKELLQEIREQAKILEQMLEARR